MFQIFNINAVNQFIISSFITDKPININTLDGKFLSCCEKNNVVDFYITDDNSGRQKWIIEKDDVEENVFYIKCAFKRYNSTQYLGCPNQNNRVFLYTSKNKYTKWSITREKDDIYQIQYVGEKFDVKEVSLVVARYNEDLDWVLPYHDIAVVYNKGPELTIQFKTVITLENVGREGHTYLYHIINNYNNLTEKCIFLQGNPIDQLYRNPSLDRSFGNRWGDPPITSYKVEDYLFKETFWVNNLRPSVLYCGKKFGKFGKVEANIDSNMTMDDFFHQYVECENLKEIPEPFYWFQKGQFVCTKQNLLSNSKEYYSKLIKGLEYTNNPIEGHYLERFWYYILHRNLNLYNEESKNIWTIWTRGDINENPDVKGCFISMAQNNLDKNVYIISNIIDKNQFSKYKNIYIVNYSLDILLTNTPAYNGYFHNIENIKTCKYWYSHETDLIRFVMLYKYGGIYLDSDILIFKNIDYESIKNTLSFECSDSWAITGSAYLCYEKKHKLLEKLLTSFWIYWNKNVWHCVGPGLINIFRNEINILDYYYFYPISFIEISQYGINVKFLEKSKVDVIQNISKSYGMHLWNSRLKKHLFNVKYKNLILDTNSFLYKSIQTYVPDFKIEETTEITLNSTYKLVQHEKINTLHSLYNISINKYYVYDFIKKYGYYVDENFLSGFVSHSNGKILFIGLGVNDTFYELNIDSMLLFED